MKLGFKEKAINLRKQGLSYSEVLKQVPVAKSTLSLWLRSVGLSKRQKQRLTEKKLKSMKRGWIKVHRTRIERMEKIKKEAKDEVRKLMKDPFWLLGVTLYWAEGTKEKMWRKGERVSFNNMDPQMIIVFNRWLTKYLEVNKDLLRYQLYIHEKADIEKAQKFWLKKLNLTPDKLKIYLKRHNPKPLRKNVNDSYNGLIRIRVQRSSDLNRKIAGWTEGIVEYFK